MVPDETLTPNPWDLPIAPNFTAHQIAQACRNWGPHLWLPKEANLDGVKLLWALSGNESSFGHDCQPRHEKAYCTGEYSHGEDVKSLTEKFGHRAHASYGPWQLLFVNCLYLNRMKPEDLFNLETAAASTVGFINTRILRFEQAKTLNQIAAAYNAGDWRIKFQPEEYIVDCAKNYLVPMPN